MNPKQARFVAEYLKDGNATRAATAAGYSAKTAKQQGSRLLTSVDVAEAIKTAQTRVAETAMNAAGLSKTWVLNKLISVVDYALGDNPEVDRYGNTTKEVVKNYAGANKALELIGKELGMFADVKVNTSPEAWTQVQEYLAGRGNTRTGAGKLH